MFRHMVLYKLKDRTEEQKWLLKERFLSMRGVVSQIKDINVGIDVLNLQRSYDVSLYVIFDSKDEFLEYKVDPYHLSVVEYVHSVVDSSVSVDSCD